MAWRAVVERISDAVLPNIRGIYYCAGIVITISVYSFLQERIMSEPYSGESFKATMFLVLCNRLFTIAYAFCMMVLLKEASWRKQAPLWKYTVASASNLMSTWCQYESLRYVSLVLQTMGKTFKMFPVMVVGMLLSAKRHPFEEIFAVTLVASGLAVFMGSGDISPQFAQGSSMYGVILLLGFLMFDSFTANFQEKLFKEHRMSKFNQMFYMNTSSAAVSALSLFSAGHSQYCWDFCIKHPEFLRHVCFLSASAAFSQFYIFSMLKEFGALALAASMNMRQVTTICAAYVIRPQPITKLQVISLLAVLSGLLLKLCLAYAKTQKVEELPHKKSTPSNISTLEEAEDEDAGGEIELMPKNGQVMGKTSATDDELLADGPGP